MDKCKFCGTRSPNTLAGVCSECMADKVGDIVEATPEIAKLAFLRHIKFIDMRDRGTGWEFALFNTITNKFVTIHGKSSWNCFLDLASDMRLESEESCQDPADAIKACADRCPGWVTI